MPRHEALQRQNLEHTIHGCGLLGTTDILQDAGNTSAYDFKQRSTEAGHRDTACTHTAKLDVRTMGPGTNGWRGANPSEGVCYGTDPGRCVELSSGGADRGCTAAPTSERLQGEDKRCSVHNGTPKNATSVM